MIMGTNSNAENVLFTIGYGGFHTEVRMQGLIDALRDHGITTLVDVRHSPCSSDPTPGDGTYKPKAWNLQPEGAGIAAALADAGIDYVWLVELGNPQRNDKKMRVLREHLADPRGCWPVDRGLRLLEDLVRAPGKRCCLLCACEHSEECHRRDIAEALNHRHFDGALAIENLPAATARAPQRHARAVH